ncbi:MAG: polysaccharide lyase family 8 super-sandwich domain-containing protein [Bacteroidota bacterium]|nr:polysaccharide lyase family 8 super-sandwich domain-containing protein [Bacteroidota bacterium]
MNNKIKTVLTAFILILSFLKVDAAPSEIEILRQKVIAELMAPSVDETSVRQLMATIRPDGTWPGIDYVDVSNTGFQHAQHLSNMVEMSRAFKKKGTKLQGDKKLKAVIFLALDYWLANDFICDNWWNNQIGTPIALNSVLLILDTDLTKDRIEKTLPMIGRAHLNASGARPSGDRIKIAGILAKNLLYRRDEVQFAEVIKVIEGEIKFNTGQRGMQHDYSFHHREDRVNNTLSYGTGYADAFAEWAAFVAGTKYQFSEKPLQQLTDYYLDGISKQMIYGKYQDPGIKNRDITRFDGYHAMGTTTPERLLKTTSYRKSELEELIKIRKGEAAPTLSFAKFFWQTEHFAFQRPTFYTSVRMHSTRNDNMEVPYNGEGLMNHHRGDGTNYISLTGAEYTNISPVYDWQKIPGTTILQKPELPSEKEIQKTGLTDFVGAVTDGKYGAVAYDFKSAHDPLAAKKAWFFFDKEYVCLGTAINSRARLQVATTLNQCLLQSDVLVMNGNQKSAMPKGERQLDQVKWILHDGIGYVFPEAQKVNLSNQAQTGSWFKINRQSDSPKDEVSKDVFKLWIDHGQQPRNASYQYIIVPGTTEAEMDKAGQQITILSNTPEIQAVKHTGLNICQAVFYTSGEIKVTENLTIGMDSPGTVMVKTDGAAVKQISVADPSRKLGKIHVSVTGKIEKSGENFRSFWNEKKGISEISIDLPQTVYAGKSITIEL